MIHGIQSGPFFNSQRVTSAYGIFAAYRRAHRATVVIIGLRGARGAAGGATVPESLLDPIGAWCRAWSASDGAGEHDGER